MELKQLLKCLLCVSMFFSIYSAPAPHHKRRRPNCRCKRIFKELNEVIESKFKLLEERFLKHLPQIDSNSNDSASMQDINSKLNMLQTEVHNTQQALLRESQAISSATEHMRSQSRSMQNLSSSFGTLEGVVRNLTRVVERLGVVSSNPSAVASNLMMHPTTTTVSSTQRASARPTRRTAPPTRALPTQHPVEVYQPREDTTEEFPRHCHDVYTSGGLRYQGDYFIMIRPRMSDKPFKVVCKVKDNGGWTVIQRRMNGAVDFYRNWTDYKKGFGRLGHEFWLGNDNIYELTNQGNFKLRVDMEEWNGNRHYAIYDVFRIDDEAHFYTLHVAGYHGNAGDSLTSSRDNHNGMRFSTFDRDNDRRPYNNCATHYKGGWWYNDCFDSNLNGRYYSRGRHSNVFARNGVQWNSIHNYSSLKFAEMMVMPSNDITSHNQV